MQTLAAAALTHCVIRHELTVVGRLGPETTPRLTQAGSGRYPRQSPARLRLIQPTRYNLGPAQVDSGDPRKGQSQLTGRPGQPLPKTMATPCVALPDYKSGGADPRQGHASC